MSFREMLKANKARANEVRVELAERQAQCVHRDDGHLTEWSRNMPKKPPPPTRDDVLKMIADAVAELPRALTPQAAAEVIHEVRKQLRQEAAAENEKLRAEISALRQRKDLHSEWMDDCVPNLMNQGKDQIVAVAACLNMWRQAWEESHPDGSDDPGPPRPEKASVIDLPSILPTRKQRHG